MLPAHQVVRAAEELPKGSSIELWRGTRDSESERRLVIRTNAGERWIRCSDPVLLELAPGSAHGLSDVLRDIMGLPHVVGWTLLNEDLVWLVDLMRWSPRGAPEAANVASLPEP